MKKILIALLPFIPARAFAQVSFAPMASQPPANIYSIVTNPVTGDLYACSGTGVIRSVNNGASWTKLANPGIELLNVLYVSPTGQLYAGGTHTNTTPFYGATKYNAASNNWTILTNSPQNITALLEDASANLYAGTGTTGSPAPAPINSGNGVYKFNGTSWAAANAGLANLPGYSVFPFIKDLKLLPNGDVLAATYGNGVQQYNGSAWSAYGSGLANQYINCLYITTSGTLYAGTDAGVSLLSGGAWTLANAGITAGKPVRAITADGSGQLYAGLGCYHFQKGSIGGELFSSTNEGASWQHAGGGFNSTSVASLAVSSAGSVFAGACGIWKTTSPNNWSYSMSGVSLPNGTVRMVENKQGDWFVICFNSSSAIPGYGGVMRSSDKGATWVSVNNGISCQRLSAIFADSYGWLWLGGRQYTGASATLPYGNPDLYKSSDNGATWIKDNTIVTPGDGYEQINEDAQGHLFVTNSFGIAQTNISSSTNHAAFVNNLNPPSVAGGNGDKAYGLGINSAGHIFLGTETAGLMRSTAGGAANTFVPITTGAAAGPVGNVSVHIDPNSDYIFCGATHGQVNGTQIAKNVFCSSGANNGTGMFALTTLPDYATLSAATFDNRGNAYLYISTGVANTTQGVYYGSFPWTSTTPFTRMVTVNNLSYYFAGFMTDECGYMYGMNAGGSGIYRSTQPANTPLVPTIASPANTVTGISQTPILTWAHACTPDSFRIQLATDALFSSIVKDAGQITALSYTVPAGILAAGTKYYWRMYGVNAAGAGKWSTVSQFTTGSVPLPLNLLGFKASYDNHEDVAHLEWQAQNDDGCKEYTVEKSLDGSGFAHIGTITAQLPYGSNSTYSFTDNTPFFGKNYYRLIRTDLQGESSSSRTVCITATGNKGGHIFLSPNPVTALCTLRLPGSGSSFLIVVNDAAGREVYRTISKGEESRLTLNFSTLAQGQYVLRMVNLADGASHTQRFAKN